MPRDDKQVTIRPALLSSLLDDEPDSTSEPRLGFKAQARRHKESVRQDLQDLLNTRQRCLSIPKSFTHLARSVLDYGIPDVTGANLSTPDRRAAFLDELAKVIRQHDARFQSVKILSLDNTDPHDRTLRFRIEATLRVETGRETAVFDFQLEPVSRHFE